MKSSHKLQRLSYASAPPTTLGSRFRAAGATLLQGLAPFLSPFLFYLFLLLATVFYRRIPCLAWGWECRSKTPRMFWEDALALFILGSIIFSQGGLNPLPPAPPPLAAAAAHLSDPTSSEAADAAHDSYSYGDEPMLPGGRAASAGGVGPAAALRLALLFIGALSFAAGILVMGKIGEMASMKLSLDSSQMWRPPAAYVVIPFLAITGLCVVWAGVMALGFGSPQDGTHFILAACAAAAVLGGAAIIASTGKAQMWSPMSCEILAFHPHHYILAILCVVLLRCHGLPAKGPSCRPLLWAMGTLTLVVKWSLIGVFVQGLAQYGADSLLRSQACAFT